MVMMSSSMTATKRKFDRLLESISNNGTSGSADPGGQKNASSSPARERSAVFARPGDEVMMRATKRLRSSPPQRSELVSSSPRLSTLLNQQSLKKSQATSNRQTSIQVTRMASPTYVPTSQEAFLQRLETFSDAAAWPILPDAICEKHWAKRGWMLIKRNTVACVTCYKRVVVEMSKEENDTIEEVVEDATEDEADSQDPIIKKYKELIKNGHQEGCPWAKIGCDQYIHKIKTFPTRTITHELIERYVDLVRCQRKLPGTLDLPHNMDLPKLYQDFKIYKDLMSKVLMDGHEQPPPATDEVCQRALAIALCGWDRMPAPKRYPSDDVTWQCSYCFRRVGSYLFERRSRHDGTYAEPMYKSFNVTACHLDYCPWVCPETQDPAKYEHGTSGDLAKTGWEILADIIIAGANGRTSLGSFRGVTPMEQAMQATSKNTPEERKRKLAGIKKLFSKFKKSGDKDGHASAGGSAVA